VIAIDLGVLSDLRRALAMVRCRVKRRVDASLFEDALAHVAAQLEGRYARDIGHEGQHLQVEHQLDMLFIRLRNAQRSGGQSCSASLRVVAFDVLNAMLKRANIGEILIEASLVGRDKIA
jgi:hypothetical protein